MNRAEAGAQDGADLRYNVTTPYKHGPPPVRGRRTVGERHIPMALIKMGQAARRAAVGSTNTIRRALQAAGIPLVTLSPGAYAVEEADLDRFLQERKEAKAAGVPDAAAKAPKKPKPAGGAPSSKALKKNKRRG